MELIPHVFKILHGLVLLIFFKLFINFLFRNDWKRGNINKLFRKRNYNKNCVRFFFHFKTPFSVWNRSSLFSALFGHAVGNEYANVRRDGVANYVSMYTPFHACWHRQAASCCLPHMLAAPTIHHTHTHHRRNKHNRYDNSRFIRQSMNRSERLIRTLIRMTRWWTCHNNKKKSGMFITDIIFQRNDILYHQSA